MSSAEQSVTGDPGTCRSCGAQLVWQPAHGIYSVPGGAEQGRDCPQALTRNHRPDRGAGLDTGAAVRVVRVTGPDEGDCTAVTIPASDYSAVMAEIMAAHGDVCAEDAELALVQYRNTLGEDHEVTIRWETVVVEPDTQTRGAVVVMRDPAFR